MNKQFSPRQFVEALVNDTNSAWQFQDIFDFLQDKYPLQQSYI